MEENNGKVKLERRITILEVDSKYTQESIKYIKKKVTNCIPTQIKEIDKKVDNLTTAFGDFKIENQKWINRILISVVLLLAGTIISIFFK